MNEYVPTAEQVNAFKAAWHDADDDGQAGKRVEIALAKVLGPALAAARREGQAEAWDEGADAYQWNIHHATEPKDEITNPYRDGADQ